MQPLRKQEQESSQQMIVATRQKKAMGMDDAFFHAGRN
jgi:hypothetical protein